MFIWILKKFNSRKKAVNIKKVPPYINANPVGSNIQHRVCIITAGETKGQRWCRSKLPSFGRSATDLHGEDEGLIDTKGLLRRDEQRGGASERAGGEEALVVHLSYNHLVGTLQHPVGESTHAISGGHGEKQAGWSAFY